MCSVYLEPVYVTSPNRHISLSLTALQSSRQDYYLKTAPDWNVAFYHTYIRQTQLTFYGDELFKIKYLSLPMRTYLSFTLSVTRQTFTCYAPQAVTKIAERLDIQSGNPPWRVATAQLEFRFPAVPVCHAFPFPLWPRTQQVPHRCAAVTAWRISEGPLGDLWAACFCLDEASCLFLFPC